MVRLVKIKLSQITGLHPCVRQCAQAVSASLYQFPLDKFSYQTARQVLTLHPVVVVKSEAGSFLLVSGFRSYQLALAILESSSSIAVAVVRHSDADAIERMAATDLLVSPLLLGLGSKPGKQIERLRACLSDNHLQSIHPDLTSSRGVKRLLRGEYD